MRAKTIYETINFKRGLDPRDAMKIGNEKERLKQKYFNLFVKAFQPLLRKYNINPEKIGTTIVSNSKSNADILRLELGYLKTYFYILGYDVELDSYYTAFTEKPDNARNKDYYRKFEMAVNALQENLERYETKRSTFNETINFKRGLNPKEAMNIGVRVLHFEDWKKRFWDVDPYLREDTYKKIKDKCHILLPDLHTKKDIETAKRKYEQILFGTFSDSFIKEKGMTHIMNRWLKRNGWAFQYDE